MRKLISFSLFATIVLLAMLARVADAQALLRSRPTSAVVAPATVCTLPGYRLHRYHRHIAYVRPIRVRRHRW